MNSKIGNFATRSVAVLATAAALLVSNPSKANTIQDSKHVQPIDGQVSVKYTGSNSKTVVFRLTFENTNAERFYLIIKNDVGDVVYEEQFTDIHFDRNIFLDVEESKIKPTFIIRLKDQDIEKKLSVTKRTATDEGTAVAL
ncbi:MAG: hypothetical protein ACHQEM_08265 [Chitinophagales bacterium]